MPPVTPSIWKNTKLADRFGAVCPQRPPEIGNRSEALLEYPRGRLLYLEKLLPLLANQSEDCLYLNLYVPRTGKYQCFDKSRGAFLTNHCAGIYVTVVKRLQANSRFRHIFKTILPICGCFMYV